MAGKDRSRRAARKKRAKTRRAAAREAGARRRRKAPARKRVRRVTGPRRRAGEEAPGALTEEPWERARHAETGPALTGGDVDADWQAAYAVGDEAVGGSVATPDQDVVDEIGRALGVEQEADEEIRTSDEILRERDRRRWELER